MSSSAETDTAKAEEADEGAGAAATRASVDVLGRVTAAFDFIVFDDFRCFSHVSDGLFFFGEGHTKGSKKGKPLTAVPGSGTDSNFQALNPTNFIILDLRKDDLLV